MIELTLLGLQSVRASDGSEFGSLAAQPKRFALLAYLAIAGGGGYHRRDALTAMFWPELDQFAARRALRNTLYHLRESIGDGVLITRGDDAIAIDPASLTCDVTKLSAAVAEGRHEEAVDYYRGELLAGVHFPNAGESFEEWLSRERARIVGLVLRALQALVERDEAAGNCAAAVRWAQRACALAPDDESWLRRSMTLLDAGDDRGSALRLYESYERRLAAEFNSRPTAESAALAARIRDGQRLPRANGTRASSASPPSAVPPDATGPVVQATLREDSAPVSAPTEPPFESRAFTVRSSRRVWALAVAVIIVALAAGTLASRTRSSGPTRARVLVVAFDNRTGDPKYESLGRMAEDWLTQGLLRTRLVDVVDSRAAFVQGHAANGASIDPLTTAHRTGASLLVSGNFYRTGDTILFQAGVVDVPTGRTVRAIGPIFSTERAPLGALDELRSRVMSALASVVNVHDPQEFDRTGEIPPFEAYQAYLEGWDAWWHGDGPRAEALFLDASHRDPAFTDAGIAVAMAASNFGACSVIDSVAHAFDVAARNLDRIQRLSLQIAVARCHGRNDEMLRLTLERAELAPQTSGLRMSAAAAAGWANQPKRALDIYEHINPQTDLAWSTDSSHFTYWSGITGALHRLGNHREELKYAERMPSVAPLTKAWLRGIALAALARPEEALAMVDTALTLQTEPTIDIGLAPYTSGRPAYSSTPAWIAVWIARELAVHGDSAASRKAATRALAWYRGRTTQERSTEEERLVAVWSLELMRSYAEAEQMLRALIDEDSTNVDFKGELGSIAAERGDTALVDSLDVWLAHQSGDVVSWSASYYRARNDALLGRPDLAVARMRDALDQGIWLDYVHMDPAFASVRQRADFVALTAPKN
ncbi:MAG TPA: BTAD domain-containing putative transcriptional regulator [Gemmatimonadaceae bacterium]